MKPIHNVITIQADITSEKCRQVAASCVAVLVAVKLCVQLVHRELKGLKADCVLHDGSPNVGAAWVQDAFSQGSLCLINIWLTANNFFCSTAVFESFEIGM